MRESFNVLNFKIMPCELFQCYLTNFMLQFELRPNLTPKHNAYVDDPVPGVVNRYPGNQKLFGTKKIKNQKSSPHG